MFCAELLLLMISGTMQYWLFLLYVAAAPTVFVHAPGSPLLLLPLLNYA